MKMFNLRFQFVDGSSVSIKIDEAELDNLRKAIHERGFEITFLIPDGAVNLSHVCHLTWEEQYDE